MKTVAYRQKELLEYNHFHYVEKYDLYIRLWKKTLGDVTTEYGYLYTRVIHASNGDVFTEVHFKPKPSTVFNFITLGDISHYLEVLNDELEEVTRHYNYEIQ